MINNILNYTKNLICFAVSSLLLLSISYAEFDSTPKTYTQRQYSISDPSTVSIGNYSLSDIRSILIDVNLGVKTFDNDVLPIISYLNSAGYNCVYGLGYFNSTRKPSVIIAPTTVDIGVYNMNPDGLFYFSCSSTSDICYIVSSSDTFNSSCYRYTFDAVNKVNGPTQTYLYTSTVSFSTVDIKLLTNAQNYTWTSGYFYNADDIPSPTPSYIPTNEEIADKVQAFYDSDLFQNQNDFKDYFVLYNYNNETFSFIGHNLVGTITDSNGSYDNMSLLGQVIYSADYPTNTVGQDYWSFRFETDWSKIVNFFNGNKYYLFSTTLDSETIIYNGTGTISDLVQLKFDPTYSTIVYSTKDYMVTIFDNPSPPDPDYGTRDIMPGDLYTYNENIDPTTSEYNPITNYVLPDSVDTLISNADIPGLLQIWVTPDFSNMGWVFLAISSFWGYFGGFVLLTAIMFFIMWLLRG